MRSRSRRIGVKLTAGDPRTADPTAPAGATGWRVRIAFYPVDTSAGKPDYRAPVCASSDKGDRRNMVMTMASAIRRQAGRIRAASTKTERLVGEMLAAVIGAGDFSRRRKSAIPLYLNTEPSSDICRCESIKKNPD